MNIALIDQTMYNLYLLFQFVHMAVTGARESEAAGPYIPFNRGPEQGEELWMHDIFGCFHDYRICIFTFIAPCYTLGRNAQYFGEDGVILGILYGLGFFFAFGPMMRWRIREKKNIRGSMLGDVLLHLVCPCCALIQENKELYGMAGSHLGEKFPIVLHMDRH